jgi:hypothetical protein
MSEVPIMPTDDLLKYLLSDCKKWILRYHEHDSLLENKVSEGLSEEERKAAWAEYEDEKNNVVRAPVINGLNYLDLINNNNPNFQGLPQNFQSMYNPNMPDYNAANVSVQDLLRHYQRPNGNNNHNNRNSFINPNQITPVASSSNQNPEVQYALAIHNQSLLLRQRQQQQQYEAHMQEQKLIKQQQQQTQQEIINRMRNSAAINPNQSHFATKPRQLNLKIGGQNNVMTPEERNILAIQARLARQKLEHEAGLRSQLISNHGHNSNSAQQQHRHNQSHANLASNNQRLPSTPRVNNNFMSSLNAAHRSQQNPANTREQAIDNDIIMEDE